MNITRTAATTTQTVFMATISCVWVIRDPLRERVLDQECEERLRQEAGLEGAAAVLVRDPTLAPVPDRLDDRDPDVSGLLFDRVDHGLDPFPHDHRLDLDHRSPSVGPRKKPRDHSGHEAPSPRRPPTPAHRLPG